MVPDKTDTGVPSCCDGSVRKLLDNPGPVFKAIPDIIQILSPVRIHFNQAVAVSADPQVVVAVHCHTPDPHTGELLCQFIGNPFVSVCVNCVQPFVRTKIENAFPFHSCVDYPVCQTCCTVNIPEIGRGHPQESQSG